MTHESSVCVEEFSAFRLEQHSTLNERDTMKQTLYDFCLENKKESLLVQWDPLENLPLTTKTVSFGSRKQVWWTCNLGHRWQATVQGRTARNNNCPYCTGRKPWPGFNDLATRYPKLAAQWDQEKNGGLTPDKVTPGSHRKVWWRCGQNHQWEASVKSRVSGNGCPVCANRKLSPGVNDFATRYPLIAAQWDREVNGSLLPSQVLPGTHRKVWWVCDRGHRWKAAVSSRTTGNTGCPVCEGKQVLPGVNDLAALHPELAAQWHPTKNLPLTPETTAGNSNRSVWWVCDLGHVWQAPVGRRVQSQAGCPVCAGKQVLVGFNDLGTMDPTVSAQWAQDLNGSLTPQSVTAGSGKKVWWRCDQDHVWRAKIYSRTGPQRSGCPVCAGRIPIRRRNIRTEGNNKT